MEQLLNRFWQGTPVLGNWLMDEWLKTVAGFRSSTVMSNRPGASSLKRNVLLVWLSKIFWQEFHLYSDGLHRSPVLRIHLWARIEKNICLFWRFHFNMIILALRWIQTYKLLLLFTVTIHVNGNSCFRIKTPLATCIYIYMYMQICIYSILCTELESHGKKAYSLAETEKKNLYGNHHPLLFLGLRLRIINHPSSAMLPMWPVKLHRGLVQNNLVYSRVKAPAPGQPSTMCWPAELVKISRQADYGFMPVVLWTVPRVWEMTRGNGLICL